MTQAEWEACDDPEMILTSLSGKASHRKLRLFASSCCWRMTKLFCDSRRRDVLFTFERYADDVAANRSVQGDER